MARIFSAAGAASAPAAPVSATPAASAPAPKASKPAAKAAPTKKAAPAAAPAVAPVSPGEAAYTAPIVARNIFDSSAAKPAARESMVWHATENKWVPRPEPTKSRSEKDDWWYKQEAYKADEKQELRHFEDKLRDVRRLREAKQIGYHPGWTSAKDPYVSMKPEVVDVGKPPATWANRVDQWWEGLAPTQRLVYPEGTGDYGFMQRRVAPRTPSEEELNRPVVGARRAYWIGEEYRTALKKYNDRRAAVETAKDKETIPSEDLAEMADAANRALRRVLRLRAELREFGWTDDKEVEDRFNPK
jgi:hypothetical protein